LFDGSKDDDDDDDVTLQGKVNQNKMRLYSYSKISFLWAKEYKERRKSRSISMEL